MKTAEEILGQIVDLSVEQVPKPMWCKNAEWRCKFCDDRAPGDPNRVRHKHGCVIAQAKEILNL